MLPATCECVCGSIRINHIANFSARYNLNNLVYFAIYDSSEEAIAREKYIKGKSRNLTEQLITQLDSGGKDLGIEVEEW